MRNLLPIGRFSEICRLSVPALRHYDELGLLPPAAVDSDTGYRYYSISQAVDADRIRTLRFLEMPLPEIRAILAGDAGANKAILEAHKRRLEEQTERQRYAIGLLEAMMQEETAPTYEIHLRETRDQLAATIRGRAPWAEIASFVGGGLAEICGAMGEQGVRFAGPPFVVYHLANANEAEIDAEVGMPTADPIEPVGRVVATTIPGGLTATTLHCGRYENLHQAYRALGEWIQEHGHEMAGPCREIYLNDPNEVADAGALRTEIVWPIR
jgi:effector-binding domain-containing protein